MVSNKELRARARQQLGGGIFQNQWLMVMLACLIVDLILSALGFTVVGTIIVLGPLSYGLVRVLVRCARENKDVDFGDLFKGFTDDFGGNVVLGLSIGLFTFLWSLLFIIPGIVKSYSYSQAFYIKHDDPSKDWMTCIDESRAMMRGHKWKLFCLDLSFIGWYLLGFLCFGIGMIFVTPYHEMARTNFYLELTGTSRAKAEEVKAEEEAPKAEEPEAEESKAE